MKYFFITIFSTFMIGAMITGANAETDIVFRSGNLVFDQPTAVGIYENGEMTAGAEALDTLTNGSISRALQYEKFNGSKGRKLLISGALEYPVLLLGLGNEPTALTYQEAGGSAAQYAVAQGWESLSLVFGINDASTGAEVAFGAKLGSFVFDKYMQEARKGKLQTITLHGHVDTGALYQSEKASLAEGVFLARTFPSEPANIIYPQSFVDRVIETIDRLNLDITVNVLDENQIREMGMGALYGVGQGSSRPPRLLVLEYNGGAMDEAPIAFVGKGITFDSGGISIKGKAGMWRMKYDLSGASSTIGAVIALAGRDAKVNVVGVAALAENMPSGTAQRPGDVVTTMSGKTIEIMSTDAEGRLVLSDAVWYTQEVYNPSVLVDLATLTGSVRTAVGTEYAGLFTHEDTLAEQFIAAGQTTGETVWRLPLHGAYRATIKSDYADIKNGGDGPGASIGAHVIEAFIQDDQPWVHLDIAGAGWNFSATPTDPKGSPGYGVRLLNEWVRQFIEN